MWSRPLNSFRKMPFQQAAKRYSEDRFAVGTKSHISSERDGWRKAETLSLLRESTRISLAGGMPARRHDPRDAAPNRRLSNFRPPFLSAFRLALVCSPQQSSTSGANPDTWHAHTYRKSARVPPACRDPREKNPRAPQLLFHTTSTSPRRPTTGYS